MKKKHIRLDRAKRGLPFQDNHRFSNDYNIGRVLDVKLSKNADGSPEGVGRVVFDTHELAEKRYNSIRNGILGDVSVGYRVYEYTKVDEVTERDGSVVPVYRATDWEPMEISLVPLGFDPTSEVRGDTSDDVTPVFLDSNGEDTQTRDAEPDVKPVVTEPDEPEPQNKRSSEVDKPTSEPVVDVAAEREAAAKAERERSKQIMDICKRAGFDSEAAEHIDAGASVESVRAIMFDKMASRQVEPKPQVQITRDENETRQAGIEGALLNRMNKARYELNDNSRRFRGHSIPDIARSLLGDAGLNNTAAVTRALQTTTEFSNLLANIATKTLMDEFAEAPRSFEPWVLRGTVSDFKEHKRNRFGDLESLVEMPEHAEFKNTQASDRAEPIQAKTYGRKFGLSRQALINDDLNAFSRLPNKIARKAASLESDLVYGALIGGLTTAMSDGEFLFSSAHGNIGSSGVISVTTLNDMVKLFRKQTGEQGDLINVMPRYLIVPPELEGTALAFLQTVMPTQASEVNIHAGRYQVVVEPRLSALSGGSTTRWYMAADPADVPSIELVNLQGQEGLQLEELDSTETLGIYWKAYYDLGVAPVEWRGIGTNPGT
jgi:hypothetical protein